MYLRRILIVCENTSDNDIQRIVQVRQPYLTSLDKLSSGSLVCLTSALGGTANSCVEGGIWSIAIVQGSRAGVTNRSTRQGKNDDVTTRDLSPRTSPETIPLE